MTRINFSNALFTAANSLNLRRFRIAFRFFLKKDQIFAIPNLFWGLSTSVANEIDYFLVVNVGEKVNFRHLDCLKNTFFFVDFVAFKISRLFICPSVAKIALKSTNAHLEMFFLLGNAFFTRRRWKVMRRVKLKIFATWHIFVSFGWQTNKNILI